MFTSCEYASPIGGLTLASDGTAVCGLWMEGQKYFGASLPEEPVPAGSMDATGSTGAEGGSIACPAVLVRACAWLDAYFAGKRPAIDELPLAPFGSEYRQVIWQLLREIPYGETTTYGELAREAARRMGKTGGAALAAGGAVGHNPISIIVPCHRVVGADGSLTGFAGGLAKKIWLLEHEGADMSRLYVPKRGTAL